MNEADNDRLQARAEELLIALTQLSIAATKLIYAHVKIELPPKPQPPPVEET